MPGDEILFHVAWYLLALFSRHWHRAQFESEQQRAVKFDISGGMKGETGEPGLQKPILTSTGRLARNKSVWTFQGQARPSAPSTGSESRSNSEHMAVAVAHPRPPPAKELLGCSWNYRERLGQAAGQESSSDDEDTDVDVDVQSETEFECHGCKKIWKDEGRKQGPSSIARSLDDIGEFKR